jgi:hypothetical protein
MKKIIISLLLAASFSTIGQSVDPGVGNMTVTDASNVSLQANSLVAGTKVLLKMPIQNLNETNPLLAGKIVIKLGAALTPDASLAASPLNNYFAWSFNATTKTIEGTLINTFPADEYGKNAVFSLDVAASGSGTIESTITGTPDENPTNNKATLNFGIVSSPLPVDLLSFSGKKIAINHNKISWTTAKEKDFSHFEIQKGADAKVFEGIGKITSTTSQTQKSYLQSYEFDDIQANNAINYYRLKMVDKDGTYKFSNIISLQNETNKSIVGEFYPNPAETYVQIDIIAQTEGRWKVTTADLSGRILKTTNEFLKKGGNRLNMSVTDLASGVSIVSFLNEKEGIKVSRKVIKQ